MVPHCSKQLVFWFKWFVKEIGMLPTYSTTFFPGCNGLRSKWVCCHILLFFVCGGGCCLFDWGGWEATIVIYLAHNPPFWRMILGNLVVTIYSLWNDIVCMVLMFDLNFTSNQVNKSIREKGSWATMWNRLGNFPLTFHKWPCLTMNLNSLKNHK
jgi:hypothetical protein